MTDEMTQGHQHELRSDDESDDAPNVEIEDKIEQPSPPSTPGSLRGTLNNILQGLRNIVDPNNKRPVSPISSQSAPPTPPSEHLNETENVPALLSSFADQDECELENTNETKTVETVKSPPKLRRSKRRTKLPAHLQHYSMCMVSNPDLPIPKNNKIKREDPNIQAIPPDAYTPSVQQTFGIRPTHMRNISASNAQMLHYVFTQYSLQQGLAKFQVKGKEALNKECTQLHEMKVFKPVSWESLTKQQKLWILRAVIFIKMKKCGKVKSRACADGHKQRSIYAKEDISSPMVRTESVLLTAVIDAYEGRCVKISDIPGAFLNPKFDDGNIVHMRLEGAMADAMVSIAPDTYEPYLHKDKNGKSVLIVQLTKELYGCVKSSMLFWQLLTQVLKHEGFEPNPFDTGVLNNIIESKKCTILFHMDELKFSHNNPGVVDDVIDTLKSILGDLTVSDDDVHTYLGIDLDFSTKGELTVSMVNYFRSILEDFPEEIGKASTPAATHLFDTDPNSSNLSKDKSEIFHQFVARVLWGALRVRPDLLTALSHLTARVREPDEDDWKKLARMLAYLEQTIDLKLQLTIEDVSIIKWWVNASFATQKDMRSQTGDIMSLGKGAVYSC